MHVSSVQCILRNSFPSNVGPEKQAFGQQNLHSPALTKPGMVAGQGLLPRGGVPSSTCPSMHVHTCEHTHTHSVLRSAPSRSNEKHLCGKKREDVPLCGLSWQQEKAHCSEAGAGWCVVKETRHALREVLSGHLSGRQPQDGHVGQAGSQVGQRHRMSVGLGRKPDWWEIEGQTSQPCRQGWATFLGHWGNGTGSRTLHAARRDGPQRSRQSQV